jgi:hypothetical protein
LDHPIWDPPLTYGHGGTGAHLTFYWVEAGALGQGYNCMGPFGDRNWHAKTYAYYHGAGFGTLEGDGGSPD